MGRYVSAKEVVVGEPSLGTLHLLDRSGATTWDGNAITTTVWTDYTCTHIPAGSKAVLLTIAQSSAGNYAFRKNGSSSTTDYKIYPCGSSIAQILYGQITIPVDSNLIFEYAAVSASSTFFFMEAGYYI